MGTDVLVGGSGGEQLVSHPLRAAILGEVHARPFTPVEAPCRVLHFAFDTSGERAQAGRTAPARGLCLMRIRYDAPAPISSP